MILDVGIGEKRKETIFSDVGGMYNNRFPNVSVKF